MADPSSDELQLPVVAESSMDDSGSDHELVLDEDLTLSSDLDIEDIPFVSPGSDESGKGGDESSNEETSNEEFSNEESSNEESSNEEFSNEESSNEESSNEESSKQESSKEESSIETSLRKEAPSDDSCDDVEGRPSHEESPSKSSANIAPPKKKRRKRGQFRKGKLKREKRHGSRASHSTTDAEQSEAYDDILKAVVGSAVESTEGDDSAISTGYMSTLPHSDLEPASDLNVEPNVVKTKKSRQRRGIGRTGKYGWKKNETPAAVPSNSQTCLLESREETLVHAPCHPRDAGKVNLASTSAEKNTCDVSTSVDMREMIQTSLASLPVQTENYSLISDYLRFTLSDTWTVSISQNAVIISAIVHPENPSIERAISWTPEGMKIFVRGMPLKQSHLLYQIKPPDSSNCGAVADYLTKVAQSFQLLKICPGVIYFEHLWDKCSHAVVQRNFGTPCIRPSYCSLLVGDRITCSSCSHLKKILGERDSRKRKRSGSADSISKANERYLENEDLMKKMAELKRDKKMSRQKIKRLEARISKLIKERSERIDAELSNDFVHIMNQNKDKMTSFQLIFWQQQSKALSLSNSRSMKWHPAMIRLALHLRMLSATAYDALRGIIALPSQRRLFDYSQFVDVKEGVQQELLEQFQQMLTKDCPDAYQKWFSLLLDEMSIRSGLVYSARTGELIGYTNLSDAEQALKELEDEMKGGPSQKRLAKKVLVLMLTGITNDIRFVAAVFSTDDLSAAQLYSRVWEVLYAVEETGAKVIAVIFDGASTNRKFITMNCNMGDTTFVYVTLNSASGDSRPLYFILDPPHLMKTFRNCLANSYAHRCSRFLWKNNEDLSWEAIEALFEIIKGDKFKATKLTKAHIVLTSFSCMKVVLAIQVFSNSAAQALVRNKDHPRLKSAFSQELVDFILIMNRFFDCLNGGVSSKKKNNNSDLNEYTSLDDTRFEFLQNEVLKYLEDWENDVAKREGNYTKEERSRMMISYQSMEAMKITIHSFIHVTKYLLNAGVPSVSSRKFNQDPLEQYFSDLRRAAGSNDNPDLKQVLHDRLSIHAQGPTFLSGGRGNTEVLKRKMENVDDSPLPVRKKIKE